MELFRRAGPGSPLVSDRSTQGADYYLGFAGYIERAFGGRVLGSAVRLTAGNTCADFAAGDYVAVKGVALTEDTLRVCELIKQ